MTDDRMALLELIEKGADADLIRGLPAFSSERLMAAEVGPVPTPPPACAARTGSTTAPGTAVRRPPP